MMPAFTPVQKAIIDFILKSLNGQLADLHRDLHRTRRDRLALVALISRNGIEIDAEEWEEAAKELEATHQIEMAFDPRVERGEDLIARILRGEEIPEEEMNQWLRVVEGGGA